MKIRTNYRLLHWFQEFQWEQDETKMQELYLKLIEEEEKELQDAVKAKDLEEILDAIWDVFVVANWYAFFGWDVRKTMETNQYAIQGFQLMDFKGSVADILDMLLNKIVDSNNTKTKLGQEGWEKAWKIIKWENFVQPDIKSVIDLFEIKLRND